MDEWSQSGTAADNQACKRSSGAKAALLGGGEDIAWKNEIAIYAKHLTYISNNVRKPMANQRDKSSLIFRTIIRFY